MSVGGRLVRRSLALLSIVVAVVLGSTGVAGAHAELVSTEPASGTVTARPPEAVVLRFSDAVDPVPGGIRLVRSDGSVVTDGAVGRIDGDDRTVSLAVPPGIGADTYVVSWRVISADSHPIRGAFTFQVGDGPSRSVGPLVERLLTDKGGQTGAGVLLAAGRWMSFAGVVLAAGWLLFAAVGLSVAVPTAAVSRASAFGAFGTVVMLGAQAVGERAAWAALVAPSAYLDVFDTRAGTWWTVRAVALTVVAVAVGGGGVVRGSGTGVGARFVAPVIALGLVTVTACGGHAVTGRWVWLGLIATVAHLLALGLWASGLVSLVVGRGFELGAEGRVGFTRRFSPWALGAVLALVLSGAANGLRQVGSMSGLVDTDYGRLLLVKLAVFAVLLAVAWLTRRASKRSDGAGLVRPALTEVALIGLVLVVTVILVNVRPSISERSGPVSAMAVVGERTAQVVLEPARTGGATLHVYLTSPKGALDRADAITVTATLSARDIGPLPLEVFPAGPNHVTGPAVDLPLAGDWTIEVTARYGEFEEVRFRTVMAVRA